MPVRTIRASEIGTYLYCQRAWWHARQGIESQNQAELLSGSDLHQRHGRSVVASSCLQYAAYALILLGLAALTVYLIGQIA